MSVGRVRVTHLDGKLPNLALMKIAAWHRARGDEIVFARHAGRDLFERDYDRVYASVIFTRSEPLVRRLLRDFPDAIVGGTGLGGSDGWRTVEDVIGAFDFVDYSLYPDFEHSIGFTMRGCRLKCGFCVVPRKEGKPRSTGSLRDIWRGEGHPRNVVLLDNDFFGQPKDAWQSVLDEARASGFRISFNQGINVRLIRDEETARAIASSPYYDDSFKVRRLYTAFDNAADAPIFRKGIERLLAAGVKGDHILSYMLVGYDERETMEAIFDRLAIMREYGVRPYPMVYQRVGESRSANGIAYRTLKDFQRWVIRRHYHVLSFEEYLACPEGRRRSLHDDGKMELFDAVS